jgi:hypothetical protein
MVIKDGVLTPGHHLSSSIDNQAAHRDIPPAKGLPGQGKGLPPEGIDLHKHDKTPCHAFFPGYFDPERLFPVLCTDDFRKKDLPLSPGSFPLLLQ